MDYVRKIFESLVGRSYKDAGRSFYIPDRSIFVALEEAYRCGYRDASRCSLCALDKLCPGCELEKALPNPQDE